jgi:hypothetical protein
MRNRRRLLWALNGLLAAGTLLGALWAFAPLDVSQDHATEPLSKSSGLAAVESEARSADDYAVIYQRNLRKPLFDPTPVSIKSAPPPKPKLKATLTGTVLEPGFTYALFIDSKGQQKLVSIGQSVEDAEVLSIRDSEATVRFCGEEMILKAKAGEKENP